MTINLAYTKTDGTQHQLSVDDDVIEVDLREQEIATIDLSPLAQSTKLEKLILSKNHLEEIDLTPLATCSSLRRLSLSDNYLEDIDLTPLATCSSIVSISLRENRLQNIDLTPLRGNPEVSIDRQDVVRLQKQLNLVDSHYQPISNDSQQTTDYINRLKEKGRLADVLTESLWDTVKDDSLHIRLREPALLELARRNEPGILPYCDKLLTSGDEECWFTALEVLGTLNTYQAVQKLFMAGGYSGTRDRIAVMHALGMILTDTHRDEFRRLLRMMIAPGELDVTRWTKTALRVLKDVCLELGIVVTHPGKSWIRRMNSAYHRPKTTESWSFLHQVAMRGEEDLREQQDILLALGLGDFGFIDKNLRDIITSISPETPIETARERVIEEVIEAIVANVDKGEATTGLKLEGLQNQYTEIARTIPDILRLRKEEMEKVVVGRKGNTVDLSELYLTAYGYEVLKVLNMKLQTDLEGLKKVEKSLTELGFELMVGNTSVSGVNMSSQLKKVIWWIVENEDKPWIEIV